MVLLEPPRGVRQFTHVVVDRLQGVAGCVPQQIVELFLRLSGEETDAEVKRFRESGVSTGNMAIVPTRKSTDYELGTPTLQRTRDIHARGYWLD